MSENYSEDTEPEKPRVEVTLPGARLKATREAMQLSREEAAHHLHLDVQIVDALESDNFTSLPSPAYVCGYLRSYARILKLPEDEIVKAYSRGEVINAALIPENVKIIPDKKINPIFAKLIVLVALVLLSAAGLMWVAEKFKLFDKGVSSTNVTSIALPESSLRQTEQRPEQIQQQLIEINSQPNSELANENEQLVTQLLDNPVEDVSQVQNDSTVSELDNPSVLVTDGDLKLVYRKDSWTEVTDAKGKRHIYRLVGKNTELFVNGSPPYTILLGDAEGVDVYYKGEIFDHKPYQRDQIAYFRLGVAASPEE